MPDDPPPAFDLSHIADQWGGPDDDIYRTILGIFADEGTKLCGDARAALTENQRQTLERAAHTMKSAAANVGALHLSRCAQALEEAAGTAEAGELAPLVTQVEAAWGAVSAQIGELARNG